MLFVKFRYVLALLFIIFTAGFALAMKTGVFTAEEISIEPLGPLGSLVLFGIVAAASTASFIYAIGLFQIPSTRLYPHIRPVDESELRSRLLALNDPGKPWEIVEEDAGELLARWKIADAKWWEILKRAGLSIQYTGRMKLVPSSKMVLYTEEVAEIEWSIGLSGEPFTLNYSKTKGRIFFSKRRAAAYAFRKLAPPDWGKVYDYDFDVNEIRGPIVETVERAGWLFQPVTRM